MMTDKTEFSIVIHRTMYCKIIFANIYIHITLKQLLATRVALREPALASVRTPGAAYVLCLAATCELHQQAKPGSLPRGDDGNPCPRQTQAQQEPD